MSDWKTIETAPKDGTEVLCAIEYGRGLWFQKVAEYGWTDNDGTIYFQPSGLQGQAFTHWIPLPEPPQEEGE